MMYDIWYIWYHDMTYDIWCHIWYWVQFYYFDTIISVLVPEYCECKNRICGIWYLALAWGAELGTMQKSIASAICNMQSTFFFCVLLCTWYLSPPTDLLLVERYLMATEKTSYPKWHKWEHLFRTFERKCIPGDTQVTCCCRAWGDTSMSVA